MTPAVVVLRTPDDARGGTWDVRLPLWRPAYTVDVAGALLAADDTVAACLREARAAHEGGNPAAPMVAVRLLRARPDLPWPPWLTDAVLASLEGQPRGRGGRHARTWTRWRDDAADYLRYRATEILTRAGVTHPTRIALQQLLAEDGRHAAQVTVRAVQQACARVRARCGAPAWPDTMHVHPRYFPDVAALHMLHAADRVAAK